MPCLLLLEELPNEGNLSGRVGTGVGGAKGVTAYFSMYWTGALYFSICQRIRKQR